MKGHQQHRDARFLKDIFLCLLSAFGGPENHFSVLMDQLAVKKKYVSETDLIEMISLCHMLPGPTSTELIIAVGHRVGGPRLAFSAMLIWALPSLFILTALSFLYDISNGSEQITGLLRFIGPMVVGFIFVAAFRMGKTVITNRMTGLLFILSALVILMVRTPWSIPLMLLIGGTATLLAAGERNLWHKVALKPTWTYLIVFLAIAACSFLLALTTDNKLIDLFDSFYRFGYLIFGGGQVAVPLMYSELVDVKQYMTGQEFMAGFGLAQGIPGPLFSFSGYAGSLAARGDGVGMQLLGAAVSGVAIFMPGLLLIFFVYPIWEGLKTMKGIQVSMLGINAVAGGMVAGMGLYLLALNGLNPLNIFVTLLTGALLLWGKLPTPILVLLTLGFGLATTI